MLDPKYIEVLQSFGNINEVLPEAIKQYALQQINGRIDQARQQLLTFEAKYGLTYHEFLARTFDDEAWVQQLWQADPTNMCKFRLYQFGFRNLSSRRLGYFI
jgi:hypothetical protein